MAERSSMCTRFMEINFNGGNYFISPGEVYYCGGWFIDKENNLMSAEGERILEEADLQDCRRRLFAQSTAMREEQTEKDSCLYRSAIDKGKGSQVKETPCKRIKLKRHMKTEVRVSPPKEESRLRTSPNKQSPPRRLPLQSRNLNISTHQGRNKSFISQFYAINEHSPPTFKHRTSMFSELMPSPSPNKHQLAFSRTYKKSAANRSVSKQSEKPLSKSKKKIHFTVYQSKMQSAMKQDVSTKTPKKDYFMPYRYNSTITIDLFQKSIAQSMEKKARSKSKARSQVKRNPSSITKPSLHGLKNRFEEQVDERILRTLDKLDRYKFVWEYMPKWQILEKIQLYNSSNEPECKWPLLLVDETFKRMREDGNFQALVSK